MKTRHQFSAFSLIELLIVVSILAILVGVIGACLAGGLRVWESARDFNTLEKDAFIGLAIVEKDMMNMLPIKGIGFAGDASTVVFPALLQSSDGPMVGSIEYSFDAVEHALVRRELPRAGGDDTEERLIENVVSLNLTYSSIESGVDGIKAWQDAGSRATNFPGKVTIALSMTAGSRSLDIERDILLPVKVD